MLTKARKIFAALVIALFAVTACGNSPKSADAPSDYQCGTHYCVFDDGEPSQEDIEEFANAAVDAMSKHTDKHSPRFEAILDVIGNEPYLVPLGTEYEYTPYEQEIRDVWFETLVQVSWTLDQAGVPTN